MGEMNEATVAGTMRNAQNLSEQCKPDASAFCRENALAAAWKPGPRANFRLNQGVSPAPILNTSGQKRAFPARCAKASARFHFLLLPGNGRRFVYWPQLSRQLMLMIDRVIFTDLDGSLLDATTYSYDAAEQALRRITETRTALVLVSSKTRAEMEPLRFRLRLEEPFVVENGGAVFIPKDYFPFPVEGSVLRGDYRVLEIGTPYAGLRAALKEIAQGLPSRLLGFGDMTVEEVATLTSLSPADARLAKQRDFDEPFVVVGNDLTLEQLRPRVEARGLRCTKGGRFYHLMGANDKGTASLRLIELYRRMARKREHTLMTIGIGDSLNDFPMLQVVDRPVLVQKPDGSYDPDIDLPNLIRGPGAGPVGWDRAVLDLLTTS